MGDVQVANIHVFCLRECCFKRACLLRYKLIIRSISQQISGLKRYTDDCKEHLNEFIDIPLLF